jgi:hypothetical protein
VRVRKKAPKNRPIILTYIGKLLNKFN